MLKLNKKTILVTMGDPKGIGPEIIRKSLVQKSLLAVGNFVVIGDKHLLGKMSPEVKIIDIPYKAPGQGALFFLDKAISLIKEGAANALVTAPLSKEAVSPYCPGFVGHTEYLTKAFNVTHFDMMFVTPQACLTIVTRHVPLKKVPALITAKAVFESIALMDKSLKENFKIKNPRLAVLGLNPHAGENGLLGDEDLVEIVPAIKKAQKAGIHATGPFPADTFFWRYQEDCLKKKPNFDGIIAMYHDQGLTAFKTLYMKQLVNFTAGLPFVRTSPAHGTAYDIAGQNKADPSSMIAALKLACVLS